MAATPRWKVFNSSGEYIAATKHVEDAAILVAANGNGSTIRDGHTKADIRWTEGSEDFPAGESYDRVSIRVMQRCNAVRIKWAIDKGRHYNNAPEAIRQRLDEVLAGGGKLAHEYVNGAVVGFHSEKEMAAYKNPGNTLARVWQRYQPGAQTDWIAV